MICAELARARGYTSRSVTITAAPCATRPNARSSRLNNYVDRICQQGGKAVHARDHYDVTRRTSATTLRCKARNRIRLRLSDPAPACMGECAYVTKPEQPRKLILDTCSCPSSRQPVILSVRSIIFLRAFNGLIRRNFTFSPRCCSDLSARIGDVAWGKLWPEFLNEILAYSCMAAFVTGIVVLAAATFIS